MRCYKVLESFQMEDQVVYGWKTNVYCTVGNTLLSQTHNLWLYGIEADVDWRSNPLKYVHS